MKRKNLVVGGAFAAAIGALGIGQSVLQGATEAMQTVPAPRFEVDPVWPKPLPNHWVLGNVIGIGIDSRDHVFIVHRDDTADRLNANGVANGTMPDVCCTAAPPVIEFDPAGNVVAAWGGPPKDGAYVWPGSNHGINIDNKGNLWIGGNGPQDSHILKFTHDGKFLMSIGRPLKGDTAQSRDSTRFGRVAKVSFDFAANEAYVADGYLNHRVAVLDMNTGKVKRFWGAYGNVPSDSNFGGYNPDAPLIQQFRTPVHCADPSVDGFIYVCDRPNNRVQVFEKNGKFVKEKQYFPRTLGDGAVWDIAFSKDLAQKYMYLADGKNEHIYVIDRASLEILTMFGDGGRQPGQWFAVHSIATDSKGNIFTTETYEGKRIQKFVYKGIGSVPKNQGVVWPKK
jgi:DNA-binding beta-propeller fold protein YncE